MAVHWGISYFVLDGYREKSYIRPLVRWSHIYDVISEFWITYYLRDRIESTPAGVSTKQDPPPPRFKNQTGFLKPNFHNVY